jgi:hypothetical protein
MKRITTLTEKETATAKGETENLIEARNEIERGIEKEKEIVIETETLREAKSEIETAIEIEIVTEIGIEIEAGKVKEIEIAIEIEIVIGTDPIATPKGAEAETTATESAIRKKSANARGCERRRERAMWRVRRSDRHVNWSGQEWRRRSARRARWWRRPEHVPRWKPTYVFVWFSFVVYVIVFVLYLFVC